MLWTGPVVQNNARVKATTTRQCVRRNGRQLPARLALNQEVKSAAGLIADKKLENFTWRVLIAEAVAVIEETTRN